ncbi:MAG TPA: TetR/AcrR family transcriptional regulator [Desulfocapsa sulfexigens]|nr:TetR/AcrR family transcriptional regulator [Desulfocapsa sulfexigens]
MEDLAPRERILHAAIVLFARHGFTGTGLRELASIAGVNLAMINYFFGSKMGLLKEILDGFFEKYLAIATRELRGSASMSTKLSRFIYSAVCYFESEQDVLLVAITELPHDDPEIIEHKANWARQLVKLLEQEICKPLAEETGRNIPGTCIGPMLTSLMASRFLFSPVMQQVRKSDEDPVDIASYVEIITALFLQGLAAQEEKNCKSISTPT